MKLAYTPRRSRKFHLRRGIDDSPRMVHLGRAQGGLRASCCGRSGMDCVFCIVFCTEYSLALLTDSGLPSTAPPRTPPPRMPRQATPPAAARMGLESSSHSIVSAARLLYICRYEGQLHVFTPGRVTSQALPARDDVRCSAESNTEACPAQLEEKGLGKFHSFWVLTKVK